ncbi:hypothetical protein SAMN05880501_10742 [Ureibacillus xyleni]|uniref:DUF4352 domain-containing protein n=1 Tax=Ureibacillus xyleni TaxID=614648 RepID=A0A285SWL2_9BACL|nr:hypothetical protein [Ureibacillus xyleni]SOC12721.1 hypothetical protein SAMN05880501_10742 [Ureibacillus xyleni]
MDKIVKIILTSLTAFLLVFSATNNYTNAASSSNSSNIEKLKKQVNELSGSNIKKDGEIKKLKTQITEKDKKIKSLETELGELKTKIKNLEKQLNPKETPQKDLIKKSDLPYTHTAKNGMSLRINSYEATSGGIKLNITLKNNSTVSDKGDIMTSTWEIYDGKNTLKFLDQDDTFWDIDYLRAGQEVTGDVIYKGLTTTTNTFTLYGSLWQYIDAEEFKLTFSVE